MYTASHKGHQAKIYDRRPTRNSYRITWQQAGRRVARERVDLNEARNVAEEAVRKLASGNDTRLTQQQINEYKTAAAVVASLDISLLEAVTEYVSAKALMTETHLRTAAQVWCDNHDNIKRARFSVVASEFLTLQRSNVSDRSYNEESGRIERFKKVFQDDMCDLSKATIDHFFEQELPGRSGKTRNHFRQTLRQLLKLAVRRDYLSKEHRLDEVLVNERTHEAAPQILKPSELKALLGSAPPELLPYVAIGGFAGLRRAEILRLTWADVWRIKGDEINPHGYIEVGAGKAKTRQRRLVPIQPALAAWIAPFQRAKGHVWEGKDTDQRNQFERLKSACNISGSNLLRHSYASYRLAAIADAARVALEMGNSQEKLFCNYNKLVSPKQAKEWFRINPAFKR